MTTTYSRLHYYIVHKMILYALLPLYTKRFTKMTKLIIRNKNAVQYSLAR
jgi:hypothetical protein